MKKLYLILNLLLIVPSNLFSMEGEEEIRSATEVKSKAEESKWQKSHDTRFIQQTFYNFEIHQLLTNKGLPKIIIEQLLSEEGNVLLDEEQDPIIKAVARRGGIFNVTIWLFDPKKVPSIKPFYDVKLGRAKKLSDLKDDDTPIMKYLKEYSKNPEYWRQTRALALWKYNPYEQIQKEIQERQKRRTKKKPVLYSEKTQEEIWETIIYHSFPTAIDSQLLNYGYLKSEVIENQRVHTVFIPGVIQIESAGPEGKGFITKRPIFGLFAIMFEEFNGTFRIFHRAFEYVFVPEEIQEPFYKGTPTSPPLLSLPSI